MDCNFVLEKLIEFFKRIHVTFKDYPYERILEDMEQFNCALSFVDTVLLKEAKRLKANILTFDYRLQNLAKKVLS